MSHTGIAGLTLGGGMGRLQRKLGLSIDCLRAVELVTADGRQVRASADENPDLFWGMRGAGANFGIATALEFDLEPIGPMITRGFRIFPAKRAREVAAVCRDYLPTASDDLMGSLTVTMATPAEEYPPEVAGEPVVVLALAYVGPEADADRVLAPLTALGPGVMGSIGRPDAPLVAARERRRDGLGPPDLHEERVPRRPARRAHGHARRPRRRVAARRGRVLDLGVRRGGRPGAGGGDGVPGLGRRRSGSVPN